METSKKRTKKPFFILLLIILAGCAEMATASGPPVQWQKTFGGSGSEQGVSVQQTSDGGYIVAGSTSSPFDPYGDVYLVKADPNGNLLWQKTFGGSDFDCGLSVQQTTDGGYVIAGTTLSFGDPNGDVYLIKTDPNGNYLWQKTFGGSGYEWGISVQLTSDGGYVIAGATRPSNFDDADVYLIKTDANGYSQWRKSLGRSDFDELGYSVQQTSDGGYIIAGDAYSPSTGNFFDVCLIKTNSAGHFQWRRTFGGSESDHGFSVQQTFDGGYVISGMTFSFGDPNGNVYLIKTNSAGNQQWRKTFGGSGSEEGISVQQSSDGRYIIVGVTDSYDPNGDIYLIKTDPEGNLLGYRTFGGSDTDSGGEIQQTADGGFIIVGSTSSFGDPNGDVYLIKLTGEGLLELYAENNWDGKTITLYWGNSGTFGGGAFEGGGAFGGKRLYRKKENDEFEYIKTVSGTSYKDTVPEPGKNYTYVLRSAVGKPLTNEATVKAEVIIVLVRGYSPWGSGVDAGYWGGSVNSWFEGRGVTCWDASSSLNGTQRIAWNSSRLHEFIQSQLAMPEYLDNPPKKINLVAHSMGGLISRQYVNEHPGFVDKIFCIHTPHTGSTLADIRGVFVLPRNPATYDLRPSFLRDTFNTIFTGTGGAKLYTQWSDKPGLRLLPLALIISEDWRFSPVLKGWYFSPSPSDGIVPVLSMFGLIREWRPPKPPKLLEPAIFSAGTAYTNYNHLFCYRKESTWSQILGWMGLNAGSNVMVQMEIEGILDVNEPNTAPLYYIVGYEGQFDSNNPVIEIAQISNSQKAYFRAIVSDVNCSFTVIDPCSIVYDPCYASFEPNVIYTDQNEVFAYEVNFPIAGTWTLSLSTTISPPNSVGYGLAVFEDANISLNAFSEPERVVVDGNVLITGYLLENDNPVLDANIFAEIFLPDSNLVLINLYDDGFHEDVNASDGIYANLFTDTTHIGRYSGIINAVGSLITGQFQRSSPISFIVVPMSIDFAGDINDMGVDLNTNGLYDILQFIIPVEVNDANTFLLTAGLFDSNDHIIQMLSSGEVNLPAGPNVFTLEVDAETIVKHGMNGPYVLRNITILDINIGLPIISLADYNTTAYLISDFEPLDTDDDCLSDNFELLIGTDVNLPDSDFDGVIDYNEVSFDGDANSYNPATDLNPLNLDTDNDGMSDGWEIYFGYDPFHDNEEKDNDDDNDGLTNLQEYLLSSNPKSQDTDFDGMPDGWEFEFDFNPAVYDSSWDFDNDGLKNLFEYHNDTDPNDPDSDDDGILDGPDNCKLIPNPDQSDMDADNKGDECDCLPDLNNDDTVNFEDLMVFVEQWLDTTCIAPDWCGGCDFEKSGRVDFVDFALLAQKWLKEFG